MHEAKRQRQKKIAERTNLRKQVCCHSTNFGSFDCNRVFSSSSLLTSFVDRLTTVLR